MDRKKMTIPMLREMKEKGEKISFLTAYDYPFALLQDRAGIDMILVGDSLGMTVLGYKTTLPVTMDDMVRHAAAVSRAAKSAFLIGDMPYMSYQPSIEDAIRNAGRFMSECGMDAIKLEGGVTVVDTIKALVKAGIPVMGHIGMTPQYAAQFGGYKVRGKDAESANMLFEDAKAIEEAGAFAVLLECVPAKVTEKITKELSILTLSIGAGPSCDGQLLIMHDVIGLFEAFQPKFVRQYCNISPVVEEAFRKYKEEVKSGAFPAPEHFYHIKQDELAKVGH
ncbi:MAG: 3-methyl-2-oxobutanoate hydroxymethyltransferase [Candidatus Eremiobacteraeota bacterium]|nr:3-methyl-2-oxobutanoate hydroxymethyltransferase [Candidatus Eremiobacteraeota bacterium]